ncbi:MAG TPA: flagellar motor protein MotB, partial [Thermodesulfobacteriota bacterium]|nr:flagellar motor protein MotB [Thermodesulfobacteriota bacterium]
MAKRKKHTEEEHENLERWLVSYADFITLLFAFFVTMYAISRVDEKKLGTVVESLQRALGSTVMVTGRTTDAGVFQSSRRPLEVSLVHTEEKTKGGGEDYAKLAAEIKKEMEETVRSQGAEGETLNQLTFIADKRGLVLRFSERFFFHSGDASIRMEIIPVLDALAKTLVKLPNHIRIEGHTDSVPIRTQRFPSNWELSTCRATSIVHFLVANHGFKPYRLSAAGYGEFRPIASNQNQEGRAQNRRV